MWKRILLVVSVVLFVAAGLGIDAVHLGSATLQVVWFAVAAFVASFI